MKSGFELFDIGTLNSGIYCPDAAFVRKHDTGNYLKTLQPGLYFRHIFRSTSVFESLLGTTIKKIESNR